MTLLTVAELIKRAKERKAAAAETVTPSQPIVQPATKLSPLNQLLAKRTPIAVLPTKPIPAPEPAQLAREKPAVVLNAQQQAVIDAALAGHDVVVVGAAGTGKTATLNALVQTLLAETDIADMTDGKHRHLLPGVPGIICTSYTRRSVANAKRVLNQIAYNCVTMHKLLEYQPQFYSVFDAEGNQRNTMRFVPSRDSTNTLDDAIALIIIDEAATVPIDLYQQVLAALPNVSKVQFIYLGDLNQLPPVFGASALGVEGAKILHTMPECVIELTYVYRQALESPILRFAHRILQGDAIPAESLTGEWSSALGLYVRPWKKRINPELALLTAAKFFKDAYAAGSYDPMRDMILMPQNIGFGTIELSKHIGMSLARTHNRKVYEVIAGFQRYYYSVGDTVMYDREDAEIVSIETNALYRGQSPKPASLTLDYWGHDTVHHEAQANSEDFDEDEFLSARLADQKDRFAEASHVIGLRFADDAPEEPITYINTSGEVNRLALAYALTVHKAQGSEWRRVFIVLHHCHARSLSRELLYTAVTRAREELYIICEPESFTNGVMNQRIRGENLEQKLMQFADSAKIDTENT